MRHIQVGGNGDNVYDHLSQEPVDGEVRPAKTTGWSLENQLPRWHL